MNISFILGGSASLMLTTVAGTAQRPTQPAIVFAGAVVIDVEHGTRVPTPRVVIVGNRIVAMGTDDQVSVPAGATVIDASGKYLIPGLWDMHFHHTADTTSLITTQQFLIANGVTGFRDAGTPLPLAIATGWLRDVLDGRRIGPARQFFSGQSLADMAEWSQTGMPQCDRAILAFIVQTCVRDVADAVHLVDSLKAAGATAIKVRSINSGELYYAIVREARRLGLPVGGHIQHGMPVTAKDAADSGVTFIEHMNASANIGITPDYDSECLRATYTDDGTWESGPASVEHCRRVAGHLRANNTWFVPTIIVHALITGFETPRARTIVARLQDQLAMLATDTTSTMATTSPGGSNWLRGPEDKDTLGLPSPDSIGKMSIAQQGGLPVLSGSDTEGSGAGFSLHAELALLVAEGMTPVAALQAATLNPAKALRLADSLGTVAVGKLADLVLLDADPLADITNTTTIRAVVANGRYFDRTALDRLLAEARATDARQSPGVP